MGVSLYYTAYRDQALRPEERRRVDTIADNATAALLVELERHLPRWQELGNVPLVVASAGELCEGLNFDPDDTLDPGVVLAGASKLSYSSAGVELMWIKFEAYLDALGEIRRGLAEARWHVHLDDIDLRWRDERYVLTDGP